MPEEINFTFRTIILSIRSNLKAISTAATVHTAHTTSMSNQMVVHHENMKASVPDLYVLAYRGRGGRYKVELTISEPEASLLLIRLVQVWPLMSDIRKSGQSFWKTGSFSAGAGTHLSHTSYTCTHKLFILSSRYSVPLLLLLLLISFLLSVVSSGVCRAGCYGRFPNQSSANAAASKKYKIQACSVSQLCQWTFETHPLMMLVHVFLTFCTKKRDLVSLSCFLLTVQIVIF